MTTLANGSNSGVVGILVTAIFIPNLKGEDLAEEDERFRLYLVSKGWDGKMGEEDLATSADEGIPPLIVELGERNKA